MTTSNSHDNRAGPSPWVERFAAAVPPDGTVLDLACGGGRHGRLFLAKEHPTTFLDRNVAAVQDLADNALAAPIEADLEADTGWPLEGRQFDAVVVTNYLWRPILPCIVAAVAPGGLLVYETFALGNEAFGRPRNPDFLLRPGELLEAVRGRLDILAYEQRIESEPKPRVIQHIAARRPR